MKHLATICLIEDFLLVCFVSLQGIQQRTFALSPTIKLFKDLNLLAKDETFRNATTIYPVTATDDFYRLHGYFSKVSLVFLMCYLVKFKHPKFVI